VNGAADRLRRRAEAIEQDGTVLARLRALFDQPHRVKDSEATDLMHGAEALIAPRRATTER
jgi:hypothetical protein